MSGLCLSAFILALVLGIAAYPVTLWPGVLLPLALAILALLTVDGRVRRGRAFAWWALGISALTGMLGFFAAKGMRDSVSELADGVLSALRAEGTDAERDRLLDNWIAADAAEGTRERVRAQYREAIRRAGPVRGAAEAATVWAGVFPHVIPPLGAKPVDGGDAQALGQVLALWVRLPCERATLYMAMVIGERDPDKLRSSFEKMKFESGTREPARVLRDLRFLADPGALPDEPKAPGTPAPAPSPAPSGDR